MSSTLRQALKHDLAVNGITAVLAAAPASWLGRTPKPQQPPSQAAAAAKAAPAKSAPAKKVVAQPQQPPHKSVAVSSEFAWVQPQQKVNVVISVFAADAAPLTAEEKELLTNMLTAIGLKLDQVGLATVAGVAAQASVPATLKSAPTLVLGEAAAQAYTGETSSLMQLRDAHPGTISFHPRTLLVQPLLKKLAWADLKLWRGKLAEAS